MEALRRGLEGVARAAAEGGVTAVLEPLNTKVNHPGYFLDHAAWRPWVNRAIISLPVLARIERIGVLGYEAMARNGVRLT